MAYTGRMNFDIFKHLFEGLKLAPKYLIAIGCVLGFLLFAPAEYMQLFGVADMAKDYRHWFGVGFLLSTALLAVTIMQGGYGFVGGRLYRWNVKRQIRKRLRTLTEDGKQILRFYVALNTRANTLRYDDGVVQGLASVGVIWQSSGMGNALEGFAYNISEAAWDELHKKPTLLDGTTNVYRTDKRHGW